MAIYKLEHPDGTRVDPTWGRRPLRVVAVRDDDADQPPCLVAETTG